MQNLRGQYSIDSLLSESGQALLISNTCFHVSDPESLLPLSQNRQLAKPFFPKFIHCTLRQDPQLPLLPQPPVSGISQDSASCLVSGNQCVLAAFSGAVHFLVIVPVLLLGIAENYVFTLDGARSLMLASKHWLYSDILLVWTVIHA